MTKTNLENYAAEMSHKIKSSGLDCYHWSEVALVIDELLKYADFGKPSNETCHVGFTNGANLKLLHETGYGAMYSDTKQECYIPIYMLKAHLHRIETTSGGNVTADSVGLKQ